jgi:hypothetical protein
LPYTWSYFYEGEEFNLLSWAGFNSYIDMQGPIPYLILLAYVIVSIGLVFMKKWARTSMLVLTIGSILASPLWGFYVSPPLDASIGYIVALADGSILTIAYFTSLGSEFG